MANDGGTAEEATLEEVASDPEADDGATGDDVSWDEPPVIVVIHLVFKLKGFWQIMQQKNFLK